MSRAINEVPRDIRVISFSGGEPFLHPRTLANLMKAGQKRGIHSTVVTNGLWYRKTKSPQLFLQRFQRVGLHGISISIDTYHRPALSGKEIISILSVAKKLGMAVNIRGAGKESPHRALMIEASGVLDGQENSEYFFDLENVGQATLLPADRMQNHNGMKSCLAATQPLVMPDGKVLACCSTRLFSIDNDVLELGHLKKEPLNNILDGSRRSFLLAALAATGPIGLMKILGRPRSKKAIGDRSRCELCLEILNNPVNVAKLRRRISRSKELRKEIAGRMMVWEHCYRPELLPQFQSGI